MFLIFYLVFSEVLMSGKKYQQAEAKIDSNKVYALEEAVKFIKENKTASFDESVELHLRLGVDPEKTEELVRGSVILPHGTVKRKKIAAFVRSEKINEAKSAGADIVGGQDLINQIKESKRCSFDLAVAEPALMKELASIAKILGPKGLMPNPKAGTVTENVKETIAELQGGKITFKNDADGNLHLVLAKVSWPENKILENIKICLAAVNRSKPKTSKGVFIKKAVICTTMGPGIRISV